MNTTAPRRTWTPAEALAAYSGFVWAPDDLIELRPLPASRGAPCPWPRQWVKAADLSGMVQDLLAANHEGANLFAGVMPRRTDGGGTDADCFPGRVVWADFDNVQPRESWRTIEGAGLPMPGMVIASGHGTHAYWRLSEPAAPEIVSRIVANLAAVLGSDSTVKNPSRIMRLPGFLNHKAPAAPCELLYCERGRAVDAGELAATLARILDAHKGNEAGGGPSGHDDAAKATTGTRDALRGNGADAQQRAALYVERIEGAAEGGRNQRGYRVAAVLLRDFALSEADALGLLATWNSRNTPPLDERELRAVLQSARKHGRHETGQKLNTPRPERTPTADTEPRPAAIPATPPASGAAGLAETIRAEAEGKRRTIGLPWPRLSALSQALRPGTVCVLAGPPGVGKSFFVASIALHVHEQGAAFGYLPLEDNRDDLLRRFLALRARSWSLLADDPDGAAHRARTVEEYREWLDTIGANIWPNPRLRRDASGRVDLGELLARDVLGWAASVAETRRVLIIDPLSQVDFEGREQWAAERRFVLRLLAVAANTGATILLTAHTVKMPGAREGVDLNMVQGAAALTRNSHCVLALDCHDPKESEVWRSGGLVARVEHERTLAVLKARHGEGPRQRIAFTMTPDGPGFEELGVIAPKQARSRKPEPKEHYANEDF